MTITKDTRISDVIEACPDAHEIFSRYNMGCCACMATKVETVEEGALMHGINVQDLIDDLNSSCCK